MIYNGGLECKISKLLPCVVACKPDSPLVCGAVVVVVLNSVKKRGHSNHPTKQVNRVVSRNRTYSIVAMCSLEYSTQGAIELHFQLIRHLIHQHFLHDPTWLLGEKTLTNQ